MVSGESNTSSIKCGGYIMHNNYIHIATMNVAELWAYAVAVGAMPSELLDGPAWLRRVPSAPEGSGRRLRR